ncbi:MAG: homoserine dehydrogenase [Planctomycetota bacterium]
MDNAAAYRVGMIGLGTVGQSVAAMLQEHAALYAQRAGRPVRLGRVLVRSLAKAHQAVSEGGWFDPAILTDDPDAFFASGAPNNIDCVLEVAGGVASAEPLVRRSLETGRHVVTANKALLAAKGADLFALARQHEKCVAFEASCGGGIPCVTALCAGLSANRIDALVGILNGTCNYILTQMGKHGRTYKHALQEAQELGFAEADPTLDVSGADAGQKLAVLAALAFGARIDGDAVVCQGVDTVTPADLAFGAELGYELKLLGIAERDAQDGITLGVSPCFVRKDDPLAQVAGSFNALSVYAPDLGHTLYYGRGAGGRPTASAVIADLLGVVTGWAPALFQGLRLTPDLHAPATMGHAQDIESRFYLRLEAADQPGVMAQVTGALGDAGISLSALIQHESDETGQGRAVPLVITTHKAKLGAVRQAAQQIGELESVDGPPVVLRVFDPPA